MKRTSRTHPRHIAMALAAGVSLCTAASVLAQADVETETSEEAPKEMTKGEKRLAKLLEGREPGEPQNCIRSLPTDNIQAIDGTAYVFGRGNTIYVQETRDPEQIDDRDTLVTRRFGGGTQFCRQDIANTIDPFTRIFTGAVTFVDFVPYTRIKDNKEG
ncbi:MAG: hypothetical protein AAFW59_09225 [Pseudomonadota bacterium]